MPIHLQRSLLPLTAAEFETIDRIVMRHAFASQNELGRLFDERIYENDLALRLRADGLEVHTQVPIKVTHDTFEKHYVLDLVVGGMIYELKTVTALLPEHTAQALHYAMLHDARRVKLLNFRTARVQGELHRNALSSAERHAPRFLTDSWRPLTLGCESLFAAVREFVTDWGTHLDTRLYNEALVHRFGGERGCLRHIPVERASEEIGTHLVQSHAPRHAFIVTSLFRDQPAHRSHLQRLATMLGLRGLQWINFNRAQIEFVTINPPGK